MKYLFLFLSLPLLFVVANVQAQLPTKAEEIKPLLIGQKIPAVTLKDAKGNSIDTKDILGKKTVLVFYRGGWCPYCTAQLSGLHAIEQEVQGLGYQIVGVSPDSPENLSESAGKLGAGYTLLSDGEGALIKAVGIAFQAPEAYKKLIEKSSKGFNKDFLPAPTVYVLNANQEIEFMYISPDFKKRLNGKMLLAVLKSL
jgi:peroxiredoxin